MEPIKITSLQDLEQLEKDFPYESLSQFESTYEAIMTSAHLRPGKTALSFFLKGSEYASAHTITYGSLIAHINQTANFFHSIGLGPDDVVAFIMPNLPETHYVIWGGEACCQVLAINPLLESEQIKDLINSVNTKAVVTMNPMKNIDLWPKLEPIIPQLTSVEHVIGVDIAHYVQGLTGPIARMIQRRMRKSISMPAGKTYYNFTQSIKKQNADQLMFDRQFTKDTISSLFCTGGTTGLPKIARRTHANELFNARALQMMSQSTMTSEKSILGGLPLFHVNGALVTGLVPLMIGASVVICTPQGYRGEDVFPNFWDIIAHFKVSAFSGVPTVYSTLMNYPTKGKDLSSLDAAICGAAPLPMEVARSFQEATGVEILEGYGLTEATCASSLNLLHGKKKIGSIGIRIPYQQMVCAELKDNKVVRICDTDEIGALIMRGPNLSLGYQLEHQNEGLWVTDDNGDTWLNSGDLARQDSDGYFWLTGRKKELIVRGGHNIEPKLIEETMCKHPDVALAAAVGRPDAHAGEVPVCYVQIADNSQVSDTELLAFASKEIQEKAAIPKAVHKVTELPLTAIGKVYKPKLEMQEIEKCVTALAMKELPEVPVKVVVKQDPKYGVLADINLGECDTTDKAQFEKLLGSYTFKSVLS
ncbi:acyl-CoA synthetase [Thalassotalea sp. G20_0]|uniref:acyl-CoA synthetase n=1 Tax=Thalassotalea sp. G20_0 TaxID=2821093 RepID=UPI001ADBE049|nr:acyl-CoA synthetase [Thalassotalea sp. G20_0]MBO9495884.1 acyl-CoA synthetase [Thalassotalea sp. G20_0]